MCTSSAPRTNHLIDALPDEVRQRWQVQLERVELPQGLVLHESRSPMSHAYFPTTAVVSLVYQTAEGGSMEFAMVGHEGVVGAELMLGGESTPSRAVVRVSGEALRLPASMVQHEIVRGGAAANLLLRFTQAFITQVAQTVVCARHHSLQQRLSRSLLMALDRVQGSRLDTTQEKLSDLLGVRREGVTEAMQRLQGSGLIRCGRGHIDVQDRGGLERQACECYAVVRHECQRLLPAALPVAVSARAAIVANGVLPRGVRARAAGAPAARRGAPAPSLEASVQAA